MIAAVTGGTGYAGQFIIRRLLAEGVEVRAWRRTESTPFNPALPVEWISGDLRTTASMQKLVEGADLLVHAALEHVPGRYRGGEGDDLIGFIEANVDGSLRLLERARRAGVGRAVVLSSRAVFGQRPRPGLLADEDSLAPDTHYGAAKAALEAFVQSWGAAEWAVAALRPTGIYGLVEPLRRTKWFDIVAATLAGEPVTESRCGTEVHGSDVAEAVWLLLTSCPDAIAGRAFNCSDLAISTRDVVEAVQRRTGLSVPLPPIVPEPANAMACAGLQRLGMRFGGRPLFEATIAELVDRCRAQGPYP